VKRNSENRAHGGTASAKGALLLIDDKHGYEPAFNSGKMVQIKYVIL
jgi:hypothetical protein